MVHEVNVPRRVDIEEYFVLRAIKDDGICKKVIQEKEFEIMPTLTDIAVFLEESKADFISREVNYRFDGTGLPFR